MKRILAIVVTIAVVFAAVAGVVVLAIDDGPSAATVGSTTISQQDIDDELRAIGENATLRAKVKASQATPLSNQEGTVTAGVGSGWLTLVISQELAAQVVARRGLRATSADRDDARQLATSYVGGSEVFDAMPEWFQDRLVERWTPIAVLSREASQDPSPAVQQALAGQCPSGRYVSHILVSSEAEALRLKQQLDAGADFATLARQDSSDPGSASQGGQLGCVDGSTFVEPFATVAATQPVGVVSDPVTTQFGSHLILVSDEPPASLVRQLVVQDVLARSRGAVVEVDPRYGTWDRAQGQVVPPVTGTAAPTG